MAATPPPADQPPAAGTASGVEGVILDGRYRLEARIAAGGMAQVWRGVDEVLQRAVAVKVLHPHLTVDETFVTRFRREAIAAARLSHPSIVSVYDTCTDGSTEAIVMELVQGANLRDRLDAGPVPPSEAATIAAHVAGALAIAHAAGLVHRDIKPANILLSDDGQVKVGDFGIAKAAASSDLTQTGAFVGTAKYLAPEQVEGKPVDGRTDLYSLGVVLYEMLCGRVPFEADSSPATALARLHRTPERPRLIRPDIPPALEAITMGLLARHPDGRPRTADAVRSQLLTADRDGDVADPALDATAAGTLPAPPPPPPPAQPARPDQTPPEGSPRFVDDRRRWLVPVLVVVLVAIALGIAGLLLQRWTGSLLGSGDDNDPGVQVVEPEPAVDLSVDIVASLDYDPLGDREEHRDRAVAGNAFDGDLDTDWRTQTYNTREFGNLKEGVGLILDLGDVQAIQGMELRTHRPGWHVEIYGSDQPTEGWEEIADAIRAGEPEGVRVRDLADSDPAFDLLTTIETQDNDPRDQPQRGEFEARDARTVLLWFTHLPDEHRVRVQDVTIER